MVFIPYTRLILLPKLNLTEMFVKHLISNHTTGSDQSYRNNMKQLQLQLQNGAYILVEKMKTNLSTKYIDFFIKYCNEKKRILLNAESD